MNSINQVIIDGTLEKDAETSEKSGVKVTKFSISYCRHYKDAVGEEVSETSLFDIEAYGDTFADFLSAKAKKGKHIRCVGRLRQTACESPKVVIVAEHIEFAPLPQDEAKF